MPMKVMETIPVTDRLPGLVEKYGQDKIVAVLSKAITRSFANLNLRVGMNSDQVVELSLMLIEDSKDDHLAFEDIMLFLEGLQMNKYGKIYDRMDMATFFELLENYREFRHKAFMRYKEEKDAQYKSAGDASRSSEDISSEKDLQRAAVNEHLKTMYKTSK